MSDTRSHSARERRFADAATLTEALAADIVATLQGALAAGRGASLVVPGGHTPVALFERLCSAELDWSSVWVTLTDERWVDPHQADSNERLVREHLLRDAAARANFVGLKNPLPDLHQAAAASWSALAELPRPFDFVLLGMGDDGHVASLFPHSPGLVPAMDLAAPPSCVPMTAPAAPRTRMSLNLRALLDSRRIAVLIRGDAKWATYQRALARGAAFDMPVRSVLGQQNVPVSIYWSP